MDHMEMNVEQLEEAARAEAVKAREAAEEAAQADTKSAAEKAAKKAVAAAEAATKLIEQMEAKKAQEAAERAALVDEPVVDPEKDEAEKKRARAMEMVTIQLFKDEERYKDDVAVFVNGRRVLIKRGVPVEVPRYIAEVVAASQKQDSQTEAMMMRLVDEYEQNTAEKTKPYGG
ncbi:MAG: hypothetical protein E7316_02285 [Clostridiales bacterium]|nr:hypothetical protein [Clostridiales bacterium]